VSLTSAFISHQIWLQRNASHEVNALVPFLEQMRDEVRAKVLGFGDDSRTRARLTVMLRELEDVLYGLTGEWSDTLQADLKELAAYESKWTAETLAQNVTANFTTPTPEQVWSAVRFNPLALDHKPVDFVQLLASWEDTEISRLVTGVKSGFVQGLATREIVKQVIGPGGLADVSARNAATVVRTALNHVSTQAKEITYQKNADVVIGYELVVTLDSRTSAICRGWPPGKVYKPDDKFRPQPPFHPNCRTTTAPAISKDYDFLDAGAKRAARGADGGTQVDANTSYYQFLRQQPAWFQDEALGPVRGKIFRNAGLTPEEFRAASVDGFGRPLTLKEMADVDARVAEYLKR
jgi:SPP1 gp7 family putative phage head morphogenesis protein